VALHGVIHHLTWASYRRVDESPDPPYDAQTAPVIEWSGRFSPVHGGQFHISHLSVTIRLDRDDTWVVRGREAADLLRHEVGHYQIAVIAARTLHSRLSALRGASPDAVQEAAEAAFAEIVGSDTDPTAGMQQLVTGIYEDDPTCGTNHGLQSGNQLRWSHQIAHVLNNHHGTLGDLAVCPRPATPARRRHAAAGG